MSYFDTAPLYGDGLAERELGKVLSGRRHQAIVATKVGMPSSRLASHVGALRVPVQVVKGIAARAGWVRPLPPFDAVALRKSVEDSLRRLKTDYIDVLLLHEPNPARVVAGDDLVEAALRLRADGKVRFFGMAGAYVGVRETFRRWPAWGQVIQCPEHSWDHEFVPDLTYGVVSRERQTYFQSAVQSSDAQSRVFLALERRPRGAIIVSSRRCSHLRELAGTVERQAQ
jgi:hypothetical protein